MEYDSILADLPPFSDEEGSFGSEMLRETGGLLDDNSSGMKRKHTSDNEATDEKRQERLERNREIARKCRRRKRERADALKEEVYKLREINKQLEIKLKICQSKLGEAATGRGNRGVEEEKRRLEEVNRMYDMVQHRCSEEEIQKRLQHYSDVYSDFGEERQQVVSTHLSQLEKLLLPTQVSKMLLWILDQEDEFFESKEKTSIWNTLCEELKLDDRQKTLFRTQRSKLGLQNTGMKLILKKLHQLEQSIVEGMNVRKVQVEEITMEITPTQQAKFLHWVERNQACIHLLDNLWLQRANTLKTKRESVNNNSVSL